MAETARAAREHDTASVRHGAILEAVAFAAERLLLTPDWHDAADEVLVRIGAAADVSRAYIIENHYDEDEILLGSIRFEWCAAGVSPQKDNPFLNDAPWSELPRWATMHAAGEPVLSTIADLPAEERLEFEAQGIVSIAEQSVFTAGHWWGAIGFDDCEGPRRWSPAEGQALRSTATLLGAAITRQRLEEQRRRAEDRWSQVVELIPAVTYSDQLDSDNIVRMGFVSPQIEQILGYPPERFLDDPGLWFSLMHPDDEARLIAEGAFDAEDTTPFDEEYRMRHADGSYRWLHDTSTAVFRDDGTIDYFLGFMTDITERRETERKLRIADQRFRTIVEQTPAVTYQEYLEDGASGGEHVETFVSPHIEELLGYSQEEWRSPGFWLEATHPDDVPLIEAESERVTAAGERFYRQDYRLVSRDGRVMWFHDESVRIDDADGKPLLWQGVMVDITDQKAAEGRLREAEERHRALVEHIPAIVYAESIEADPHTSYVSPQVQQILGFSPEEWRSTPGFWRAHLHPDDLATVIERNDEAHATGGTFLAEYRFLAADGNYRWLRDQAVRIQVVAGEPLFWQGVLFDITDQKQAQQELREVDERYRALVENVPAVIYTESPDADSAKFYISPQVTDLFGYTAQEWTWTRDFWRDRVHPDDVEDVFATDDRSNHSLEPYSADYRFRHRDGHYVWVRDEATFVPERDGDGFWQGFLLDITRRKEAEEQLREAELKFRTIVEQNQAIFYTQDIDPDDPSMSKTTYIAPRNTQLVGYSLDEITGDPLMWRSIVHPDDRDRVFAADAETNRDTTDDHFSMEYRMIGKDRRIVWVQDEATLVRLPGKPPYWQGFLLDVTDRKEAEGQLERALDVEREATQRLRALDEMKNTFLQAVSHDLRTPLAAILGLAITLERGDVELEEDDARDLAHRIASNARRLDRMVMNLLDLDRLARGIVAPKLEETDVGALVQRVLDETAVVDTARLHTQLEPVVQAVDAAKVERIVENLLANSARHTPSSASISVGVRSQPDGVLITVDDNGPGVPTDMREVIFEPFRQGPDAPQHSPGVGVGLTLVRRFAELHGGRAWVQDRDGGGASFRVFLPARGPSQIMPPDDVPGDAGGLLPPVGLEDAS